YDRIMLILADEHELSYERDWVLYWLPEDEEILHINRFVVLLYYATLMPRDYRDIFLHRNYNVGGAVPEYRQTWLSNVWTQFIKNTDGYVYDPYVREFVFNPQAADRAIVQLQEQLRTYIEE